MKSIVGVPFGLLDFQIELSQELIEDTALRFAIVFQTQLLDLLADVHAPDLKLDVGLILELIKLFCVFQYPD